MVFEASCTSFSFVFPVNGQWGVFHRFTLFPPPPPFPPHFSTVPPRGHLGELVSASNPGSAARPPLYELFFFVPPPPWCFFAVFFVRIIFGFSVGLLSRGSVNNFSFVSSVELFPCSPPRATLSTTSLSQPHCLGGLLFVWF